MKYTTHLGLLLLLLVAACSKESFEKKARQARKIDSSGEHNYKPYYYENSAIKVYNSSNGPVYDVVRGSNNTVFSFSRSINGPSIVFQADSGVTSFTYTDKELTEHKTHYAIYGGCFGDIGFSSYHDISKGTITGKWVPEDNVWLIMIDVTLPVEDAYIHSYNVKENSYYYNALSHY